MLCLEEAEERMAALDFSTAAGVLERVLGRQAIRFVWLSVVSPSPPLPSPSLPSLHEYTHVIDEWLAFAAASSHRPRLSMKEISVHHLLGNSLHLVDSFLENKSSEHASPPTTHTHVCSARCPGLTLAYYRLALCLLAARGVHASRQARLLLDCAMFLEGAENRHLSAAVDLALRILR